MSDDNRAKCLSLRGISVGWLVCFGYAKDSINLFVFESWKKRKCCVFELCFLLLMTFFVPLVVICLVMFGWARARLRAESGPARQQRFRRIVRQLKFRPAGNAGKVTSIVDG